jgi:hypothetical protein
VHSLRGSGWRPTGCSFVERERFADEQSCCSSYPFARLDAPLPAFVFTVRRPTFGHGAILHCNRVPGLLARRIERIASLAAYLKSRGRHGKSGGTFCCNMRHAPIETMAANHRRVSVHRAILWWVKLRRNIRQLTYAALRHNRLTIGLREHAAPSRHPRQS